MPTNTILSILLAVLIFGLIVLIHEFGHFIAARACGVFVEEFAMGMGPVLLKKQGKETLYTLRAFPVGGFCRMRGDNDGTDGPKGAKKDAEQGLADDERSLNKKPTWQRFIIFISGAAMNFVLAVIVTFIALGFTSFQNTVVSTVLKDSPGMQAGILPGDKIVRANGIKVGVFNDIILALNMVEPGKADLTIERDGRTIDLSFEPVYNESEGSYKIGVICEGRYGFLAQPIDSAERAGFFESLGEAVSQTESYIRTTLTSFKMIFTGKLSPGDLTSIVGATAYINDTVEGINSETQPETAEPVPLSERAASIALFAVSFCALISANVGVMNLLPLPALDGGRCVFLIVEAIRRKPLDPNKEGMIHFVGLVLFMLLAVFVIFSDIMKII